MSQELSFPFSDILTEEDQRHIYNEMSLPPDQVQALLGVDNNYELNESFHLEDYKQECTTPIVQPQEEQLGQHEQVSLNPNNVLSNEEYSGPYDFEVSVIPNLTSKNPWVYSAVLNKVFMDMMQQFPVDFKVKNRPAEPLFIRVTAQYSLPQYASDPVYRCIQHDHHQDSTNLGIQEDVRQHVLRCTNNKSQYMGIRQMNHRLSIVFPFAYPQIGSDSVREMFYFVCKSSCPTPGMNRRAIEVIFTLENGGAHILGRKCLNVRICACPKRDKEKEEKEYHKEKLNSFLPSKGKKRKVDNHSNGKTVPSLPEVDNKEYIFNMKLVGKQSVIKVLNYTEDVLKAQICDLQKNHQNDAPYQKNLHEIQALKSYFTALLGRYPQAKWFSTLWSKWLTNPTKEYQIVPGFLFRGWRPDFFF